MKISAACALAALFGLGVACTPAPPPAGPPRFLRGEPYQMGGMWSYPEERFSGSETGLAGILPGAARATANGEAYDPARLLAAHRTLQLPAIVTVENLANGRALRLRVNDRGPENPARLLGLSPRAATLLGLPAGGVAPVRVTVDGPASLALAGSLPGGDASLPKVVAAPAGRVDREALAPLPGASAAPPPYAVAHGAAPPPSAMAETALPPDPLPEEVHQGQPQPGTLWLEASDFQRQALAAAQARQLGGMVVPVGQGRNVTYRVRQGPFADAAAAEAAFATARKRGLTELRVVVE